MTVKIDLCELEDTTFDFYGAAAHSRTLKLDNLVLGVHESYRGCSGPSFDGLEIPEACSDFFFKEPIARVRVEEFEENDEEGYRLIDVYDGHCWVEFGDNLEDPYYPFTVFRYMAKSPAFEDMPGVDRDCSAWGGWYRHVQHRSR